MRTTYRKVTGRGLTDDMAKPQKIKYIVLVANKQIYLFWLSESFQIPIEDVDWSRRHYLIVKIVPIIDNSLWEKVVSEVRLIDFD